MPRSTESKMFPAGPTFWVLAAFVFIVFFTGGSSRADVSSLAVLRPLSVFVFGFSLLTLNRHHVYNNRFILWSLVATLLFLLVQVSPIPSFLWSHLSGRDVVANIDQKIGSPQSWRAISLSSEATINTVFALFVPLSVITLGVQLNRDEHRQLFWIILGLCLVSGFIGLLQAVGNAGGPLYFYSITNAGSAVGLFANRNHQALMLACLFPIMAAMAFSKNRATRQTNYRMVVAAGVGIILLPLLLITGSRGGLLLGFIGIIYILILHYVTKNKDVGVRHLLLKKSKIKSAPFYIAFGFIVAAWAAVTVFFARGEAIDRLNDDESRGFIWQQLLEIAPRYLPLGTGSGTFSQIYQLHEPDRLLTSVFTNQAHSDWLDMFLTSGVLGILFLTIFIIGIAQIALDRRRLPEPPDGISLRFVGLAIISIILVGSIGDYPVRVPIISVLLAISLIWLMWADNHPTENAGTM